MSFSLHITWLTLLSVAFGFHPIRAADVSLPSQEEIEFLFELEEWELAKTAWNDEDSDATWTLRSDHLVFGMPRLVDNRYNFTPPNFDRPQPGISILAREAFIIAHFDRMRSPLWVAQIWTRYDYARMRQIPSQDRPWQEDPDLPPYARGGVWYDGQNLDLDRGHMARHAKNRGWGIDGSNWGSKMSNSTPQHRKVNRDGSTWGMLEDELRDIVVNPQADIDAIWVISGTIWRDRINPDTETPEDDFAKVVRITTGFGLPDATYKLVGWFDRQHRFQARAYVFEQPHTTSIKNEQLQLNFDLGNTQLPMKDYLVSIDELEARTGLDFFPLLQNNIEQLIEREQPNDLWGAH